MFSATGAKAAFRGPATSALATRGAVAAFVGDCVGAGVVTAGAELVSSVGTRGSTM
ncbi:hypothetical protein [Paenarthrobacter ureafaciens]|uniref:hypothetical protein n=1 Tax=Paenarthrobacter ureafaciens TaxID=37931 RepID=UPI0034DB585E